MQRNFLIIIFLIKDEYLGRKLYFRAFLCFNTQRLEINATQSLVRIGSFHRDASPAA